MLYSWWYLLKLIAKASSISLPTVCFHHLIHHLIPMFLLACVAPLKLSPKPFPDSLFTICQFRLLEPSWQQWELAIIILLQSFHSCHNFLLPFPSVVH